MVLAEHDNVVEKLSPNSAHEALCRAVLPRAPERRAARGGCRMSRSRRPPPREDRVVVEDQETMGGFVGETSQSRVRGHVEVEDSPAPVVDREPDVEQLKAGGRHDEEVHPCLFSIFICALRPVQLPMTPVRLLGHVYRL